MKLWTKLILAGFGLMLVAIAAVFFSIDYIAKTGVEAGGTYAFGVPTTLASMDVGVFGGTASMNKLNVENPPGYQRPNFLTLADGSVAVTLSTLLEDRVEIPSIKLKGVDMTLLTKDGKANYETIMKEMEKIQGSDDGSANSEKETEEGKSYVIDQILIEDIHVVVDSVGLDGGLTELEVDIDQIELKDVGSGEDQERSLAEVNGIIMKAILEAVVKKAGTVLPQQLLDGLTGGLKDLEGLASASVIGDATALIDGQVKELGSVVGEIGNVAGEIAEGTGEVLEEGAKALTEPVKALDDVGKGLEGLFKKPEKDDG